MTRKASVCGLALAATIVASGILGGCGGVRNNLTPELMTLDRRPVDVSNTIALTFNENKRMIWGDLNRASYMDRPTRLTPHPSPW
jgi:hypothetical protein